MTRPRTPLREMPVVILCGGQGMRLREETEYKPKPMVEIGGKPILWHIMKTYGHHGVGRFVLCLGYLGYRIKQYFLRYHEFMRDFTLDMASHGPPEFHNRTGEENWRVTLAETGELAGTGARLKRVEQYIDTDTFLFTYGDCVGAVDIERLVDFHYEQGRIGTVTGVHPMSRYGEMEVEEGRALEFNEKPMAADGVVSGGYFVLDRRIFDYLDDSEDLFFEAEPLQRLARDGELSVYLHEDFWFPMDTYRDNVQLNKLWASGKPPWKVWKD